MNTLAPEMNLPARKYGGRFLPFVLFLALWGFHLYSAGGALVPYRDTGEMVTNAQTLGIAHPPGYPLYVLLGKTASQISPGNPSYRVNLLSALASALAGTALFLLLAPTAGTFAAVGGAALWATSPIFWEVSSLSEMYSLGILFVILLFILLRKSSFAWALIAFLWGVSLGIRTDYLLLTPALVLLMARRKEWSQIPAAAVFFFLGLSIFLYLPIRSAQQPWIDWNNPEVLSNFIGSLLRRSHGGTLDLLSKSYKSGENFASEMMLFLKNAAGDYTWLGLPLAALGMRRLYRQEKDYFYFLLLNLLLFCPVFIYLANMPPNPHAVAIVEAHYLVPQLILLIFAVEGIRSVWNGGLASPAGKMIAAAAIVALAVINAAAHRGRGDKRWNLYGRDETINALRSALPNSIGIVREDVPLFALWEKTMVSRQRTDITPIGQGLAASPWYHEMLEHEGQSAELGKLTDAEDWPRLVRDNPGRAIWASGDANYNGAASLQPWGDVLYLSGAPSASVDLDLLRQFAVVRGDRRQTAPADFFSSNILSNYARAVVRRTSILMQNKKWDETETSLQQARVFDSEFPTPLYHLGFVAFQKGDLARAENYDAQASALFEKLFEEARYYKSLPDVVDSLRQEAGEVWLHRGVVAEKRADVDDARRCYAQAINLNPRFAQAYYNLGVTFWNRDWGKAADSMQKAAELAPSNSQYQVYFQRALQLAQGKKP